MHSSGELTSSSFEIEVDGVAAPPEELFEGFGEQDRLGVTRPAGSASRRRLDGWVDRRARELIYHDACSAPCPTPPPRDDDRRPIAGALVRSRPVVEAFKRPRHEILPVSLGPCFADPAAKVGGVHVYTFNEPKTTETWRRQLVDRLNNQEETPWHR
jgi:hypothetical protein